MAHGSTFAAGLALLLLAAGASATTVGAVSGTPVPGRPLAVNVPFVVDAPADRACASASVRYGSVSVPHVLHVQQTHGVKRSLLVTSHANVSEQPVRVDIRVGCGMKAIMRQFVLQPAAAAMAKTPPPAPAVAKAPPAPARTPTVAKIPSKPKTVAFVAPSEPLFPPPAAEPEGPSQQDLRKAQDDAATAVAQLAATRKELAAVLDIERRTAQTLINADHQVRDAQSEVARMRFVLKGIAAALALGAAAVAWFEFMRVTTRRRMARAQPQEEPSMFPGPEMAA